MGTTGVAEVLAYLKVSDPKEVTIDELPGPAASADSAVADQNARRHLEATQRREYVARARTVSTMIGRETAMQLRQQGAQYIGKRQPDPWREG